MSKEIYEIPVVLTIHGRIKIRADSEDQARLTADKLSTKRARQALVEDFTFKSLVTRHEVKNNGSSGILEETDGKEDNDNIQGNC